MVKRLILSSLVILLPSSNYSINFRIGSFELDTNIIVENKDAILFVSAATCLATAFFLCCYLQRFKSNDVHNLKVSTEDYLNTTSKYYNRELQLLDTQLKIETIKSVLEDIVAETDSDLPYVTYTSILKNNLKQCREYENCIEKNLLKLKNLCAKLHPYNTQEIMHYQILIKDLSQLDAKLLELENSLKKLISYCIQYKGFRHEQMIQILKNIECQKFIHVIKPNQSVA